MEYNLPTQEPLSLAGQQQQGQQQQAAAAPRGRGRRQYAAQQYDFNAPAPDAIFAQQQHPQQFAPPGFQQGQIIPPQYGQPQQAQTGVQYGQEYQQLGPNMYQHGEQQVNVGGIANQFQQMQVTQVYMSRNQSNFSPRQLILLFLWI